MSQRAIIRVPTYEEVSDETKLIFDNLFQTIGKIPDIYAILGYSANALGSYLEYFKAQAKGVFRAKEREAIFLIVSQVNNCEYCIAFHTISAIKLGWTEEETLLLRSGEFPELKWKVIHDLIKSTIENKGDVNDDVFNSFFEIGYDVKALIEIIALINVLSFTNHIFNMTKIPVNLPLAKKTD